VKAAEADYGNLKVQVNSELASQKANEASVRSDFEQAKLQAQVDEQLFKQGLTAEVTAKLSKVRAEQLAIRIKLEEERTRIASDSAQARLDAQRARVAGAPVNGTVAVDISLDGTLAPGARPDLSVDGTITIENLRDVMYVGRPVHGQADSTIGIFKLTPDGGEATRVNVKLGRVSV